MGTAESQRATFTLDKYYQVIKRRWTTGLGVFVSVFFLAVVASSLKKPVYESEAKISFQRTNTISTLTGVGTEIGKLETVAQDQSTNPLNTEAEIIRSVPLAKITINKLNLKDSKGSQLSTEKFLKNLIIKDVKGADILKVSYKDRNPKMASDIANTVINTYLEHNISSRRKEAATARIFLEKQVPTTELVVRKAEAELAEFKDKNQVVALQEEANNSLELIKEWQKQLGDAQSQIANISAQSQEIRQQLNQNPQQAVAVTAISQSPGVQDILKEIQQLESQIASRRTVLRNRHPEIINLQERLKALNEVLQQRIQRVAGVKLSRFSGNLQAGALQQQLAGELVRLESTRQGLISQVAALSTLKATHKQRLNTIPRLEQQQRQLERKVQASQSTYLLLLQKLQESRLAESQKLGNVNLVSEAQVPEKPVSSPVVSYLSAALLASLAAMATMFVLEARDKSIKTVDEAKELLELTLLGVIPLFNYSRKAVRSNEEPEAYTSVLVVRDIPRSPISEAYRMLRANLKFISADKELKAIVITSSIPGEGKSTVAANLALAMAQMERRVLLVDADLHRPVQHQIWELTNSQGLSNLIVGQTETRTAVKQIMDNLDVLTSGVVPPSPASLLDSKRMASLIENFTVNYDFVIIDTPSLNVAADAATLGQMADGVLFIVRPGLVDAVHATAAREILEKSGQNVLGQVVNAVIPQNESHSYYYFNDGSNFEEYSDSQLDVTPSRSEKPRFYRF